MNMIRHLFGSRAGRMVLVLAASILFADTLHGQVTFDTRALSGEPAPDTGTGVFFNTFTLTAIDAQGAVVFGATLGGGISSTNDSGLWSDGGGLLSLLAREGEQAPGTDPGVVFSSFGNPLHGGTGSVAVLALNSTFSDNSTGFSGNGGGVYNHENATLIVSNSTFAGNLAYNAGGAIYNHWYSKCTIHQSTLSSNSANYAGAIDSSFCTLVISDSTLSGNHCIGGSGGALRNSGAGYTVWFCRMSELRTVPPYMPPP